MASLLKFNEVFKLEIIPILHTFFQNIKEGILPNPFFEARGILITKPEKKQTKKTHKPISLMNIDVKIINKILVSQMQQKIKRIMHQNQVRFTLGRQC